MTSTPLHTLARRLLSATLCALMALTASAYEKRNFLQQRLSRDSLAAWLISDQSWVPYPAYADRAAWSAYIGDSREPLVARGEQLLSYRWQSIPASAYLAYRSTGDRLAMENPYFANQHALCDLFYAELAEGRGRFIPKIIDGVWHMCEMTSWTLSAHLPRQHSHSSLPDYNDHVVAIFTGDMGELLAWIYYFLHDEFDKVTPQISARLRHELRRNITDPFMTRYWSWTGLGVPAGSHLLNNWTPWCCHNVALVYLLMEGDRQKLADAQWRLLCAIDEYLNYTQLDGACDEGPGYWSASAERVYQYLDLLRMATGGKANFFSLPFLRAQGEYIARSYVGNGWVVNFADAGARSGVDAPTVWLYGDAVHSPLMKEFAAYLMSDYGRTQPHLAYPDIRRLKATAFLSAVAHRRPMEQTRPALHHPASTWYAQTQFCYMTSPQGLFLACKGGHNNESHNHNDVGSFALYVDTLPVFIDVGVGTYTKQTFDAGRYKIWTMQSDYHNLPRPNGVSQHEGRNYCARNVRFDARRQLFSADIAGAYPQEAHVKKWVRSYRLKGSKALITDRFELAEALAPNEVNFMTWGRVDASRPGVVTVNVQGRRATLRYDAARFAASVEHVEQTDPKLHAVWGGEVVRVTLRAGQLERQGVYQFTIEKP